MLLTGFPKKEAGRQRKGNQWENWYQTIPEIINKSACDYHLFSIIKQKNQERQPGPQVRFCRLMEGTNFFLRFQDENHGLRKLKKNPFQTRSNFGRKHDSGPSPA